MSTIYDKYNDKDKQKQKKSFSYTASEDLEEPQALQFAPMAQEAENAPVLAYKDQSEDFPSALESYKQEAGNALTLVDDIVLKQYLSKLSDMSIVPFDGDKENGGIVLYKINKMVYEKDEYTTDKFISVISSMTYTPGSVFMIVDGHKDYTDFYLGVKNNDPNRQLNSVAETFKDAVTGQFPGAQISDLSYTSTGDVYKEQDRLFHKMKEAVAISQCTGIPSYKNSKGEYTNATFIQGIEKFAEAMHGREYTAIILASNLSQNEISDVRFGYESIYTKLSTMATQQIAYSTNESLANALTRTKGYSDGTTITNTQGVSNTHQEGASSSQSKSISHTVTKGESKENIWGKASKVAGPLLAVAGAAVAATGFGAPIGVAMMAGGASGAIGAGALGLGAKQLSKSESDSTSNTTTTSKSISDSTTQSSSHSEATSHTETFNESNGQTSTIGSSKNFTITSQNKHIQEILKRIDKQLDRISISESTGLWSTCAYFLSYGTERSTAETCATIFRSIMQGEQSGVELSAINTWYNTNKDYDTLNKYLCVLSHPQFAYNYIPNQGVIELLPTNMLSSKEVAILMGLPRKSVPGFPVIEHISLGKEVVRLSTSDENKRTFELGCIFDQGVDKKENKVSLDLKSLTQHTFVTGSTGCGKSETVYKLIDSIGNTNAKFLIIEPAKGEYKKVFGTARVFGTNPLISELLKINPFKFVEGVHVLEHADRLIEIFNVCWPMYAAMPAVLKEAVLNAYEDCGWDLLKSKNKYSDDIFPTFSDLIWELETVIEASSYSEEVKSNYKGSLVTRVKSLANGINGEIFSGNEIGDHILFDENVIVDLSRIGSQETKSLIMGILVMRLNEYRTNSCIESNSALRHVTILEEAHNILKRCSQEQSMEGSNVAGKSVEMISNAIAEMRTYGEGFIIVDQSPGAVDISAIRNTNTKIIMRLPEDSDRKIAGKSAAMRDNQVDEIAKLPTGVAVVYQNDWEEPVLCHVDMYKGNRIAYKFLPKDEEKSEIPVIAESIKFMMQTKVPTPVKFDIGLIKDNLSSTNLPTYVKLNIFEAIQEFEETGTASIWRNPEYQKFSWIISGIFNSKKDVLKIAKNARDFDELTDSLKHLIHNKVTDIPYELDLSICQSLLRDYSLGDEKRLKLYTAWYQKTKDKLL